jgi:hypothetical protein
MRGGGKAVLSGANPRLCHIIGAFGANNEMFAGASRLRCAPPGRNKMKNLLKAHVLAAALLAGAAVMPAHAEGEKVGDTQMCIESNRIRSTQILNHKTILVRMVSANEYKRIDILNNCSTLDKSTGFAYDTSINKLCKQDTLTVLDSGQTCMIDQIVTIDAAEAKALQQKRQ